MPFSISQMLGGFRKKDSSPRYKEKTPRREVKERVREVNESKSVKTVSEPTKSKQSLGQSDLAWSLIVRPHISEKSTMMGEGKYILRVSNKAKKGDLKRAVGDRYGVEVEDVKILNMPSKERRRGNTIGIKPGFKKAIITLAKGQLINEF